MPANVAARPPHRASSMQAFALLLLATCSRQRREIERLAEERAALMTANRELVAERDELRRRLGLNSTNSSKPPSSDGLKRKRRTARSPERERRKRLGRRPGKQKGAPGHHLAPTTRPDRVVDPPPPSGLETTEHRAIKLHCLECGHVTKAKFPECAKAPVQYGPRIHATASYLAVHQYMPYERMVEYIHDAYGAKVSAGTLVAMMSRAGQRVLPAVDEIKGQLQRAAVVNVDETGCHVGGKLKWVHGAATDRLTLLGVDDHRGVKGIKGLGVLGEATGIVIHDAWPAYWNGCGSSGGSADHTILRVGNQPPPHAGLRLPGRPLLG